MSKGGGITLNNKDRKYKRYDVSVKIYIEDDMLLEPIDISLKVKYIYDRAYIYDTIANSLYRCKSCGSRGLCKVVECAIKYVQYITFSNKDRRNIEYTLGKYMHENDIRHSGSVKQFKLNATIRESKET